MNDFNTYYVVPLLGSEKEGGRSGALGEIVACNNISYTYSIPTTVLHIWDSKLLEPAAWFIWVEEHGICTIHLISAQISQKGSKSAKSKE